MSIGMPLITGTRLGPYDIIAPLGQGGMGSACGHAEGISVSPRWGWGLHHSPEAESLRSRPRNSEALHGVGVGPHADKGC